MSIYSPVQSNPNVYCPFCGGSFELVLDGAEQVQQIELDCENCCRPLHVRMEWEGDEILSLDVSPGW
jgi:hypothetical protein